ncbi:MAG: AbrB/MazE/SpoVT family DNA-binding domain-containing protein [Candidatus Aenigmarchaeota archaeon]|nr:AbrB/MazE/SpoVT family DNA-binding domain-containing protein [Candidatus Aenigmarchaeota archaeon]
MKINVTTMDSKGRISIPFHLRNLFGLDIGDELVIDMNEQKEIVLVPLKAGDMPVPGAELARDKRGFPQGGAA